MRRLALLVACVVAMAACGITLDEGPRDIPASARRELLITNQVFAGPSIGSARIYLRTPARSGRANNGVLRSVARDVEEIPMAVMNALFAGPNEAEVRDELTSAIPRDSYVLSVDLRSGVLSVDVSGNFRELTGSALVEAVAQIVLTATAMTGIQSVRILLSGIAEEWPDGSGVLRAAALSKYDFPGFVETTQPDFPPIPSPTTP